MAPMMRRESPPAHGRSPASRRWSTTPRAARTTCSCGRSFLLLLVGFSMACWIGSYLVFARPELPISYKLLRKIHKIDAPQRFKVTAAPKLASSSRRKNSTTATRTSMNGPEIARPQPAVGTQLPAQLLRRQRARDLRHRTLHHHGFLRTGARAISFPRARWRWPSRRISPGCSSNIFTVRVAQDGPLIQRNLQTGMDVELRRTYELTAILHVARLTDGHLQLTVVPINYGRYLFTGTNGGFELQPPSRGSTSPPAGRSSGGTVSNRPTRRTSISAPAPGQGPDGGPTHRKARSCRMTALKGVDAPLEPPPAATPAAGGVAYAVFSCQKRRNRRLLLKGPPWTRKNPWACLIPAATALTCATLIAQAETSRCAPRCRSTSRRTGLGATPASVLKATAAQPDARRRGACRCSPSWVRPAASGPLGHRRRRSRSSKTPGPPTRPATRTCRQEHAGR